VGLSTNQWCNNFKNRFLKSYLLNPDMEIQNLIVFLPKLNISLENVLRKIFLDCPLRMNGIKLAHSDNPELREPITYNHEEYDFSPF
jgi:hypothetical protein